ncbi:MAG: hypothetical protein ILP11_02385 [Alphaproteobacteria bacterium]|nr:hypothetical protein [Alphaproteobacteria bacterium]
MIKFTIFPPKKPEQIDPRKAVQQEGDGTAYPQQHPETITKQNTPKKGRQRTR